MDVHFQAERPIRHFVIESEDNPAPRVLDFYCAPHYAPFRMESEPRCQYSESKERSLAYATKTVSMYNG